MLKMRSGVKTGTSKNLMIGPGVAYVGFQSPTNLGKMLGATKGGNNVNIAQEWHESEIDGVLGPVKGARWLVGETVEVETNLLEITRENLELALPGCVVDSSDIDYDVISQTDDISKAEYMDVAIVGEISGKQEPVIFVIKNALAVDPVELPLGTGKDDVVLKVKFRGHYTEEEPTTPPYEIYYPKKAFTP